MEHKRRRVLGFTLVEIMIVVTIIGILASLAVPAFQRARWKALETSIRNNLRQIWGAAQQYMMENGVGKVDILDIVEWKKKSNETGGENNETGGENNDTGGENNDTGKNEGYTSVLQQVADEKYNSFKVARSGSATSNILDLSKTTEDLGGVEAGSMLYEDTTGIEIEVPGSGKWVKLVF